MKSKTTFAMSLILLACNLMVPAYGQSTNGDDVWSLTRANLSDGAKLAKNKKKLEQAREKFEELSGFWQNNHYTALYLTILDDVNNNEIKTKTATEIFKAIEQGYDDKWTKVLKTNDKILKKNKDYFPAHIIRGDILANLDEREKAEEAFANAINVAQDEALPYVIRGKFYAASDRPYMAV